MSRKWLAAFGFCIFILGLTLVRAQSPAQAQPQEQPTAQPALAPAVVEQSFYQNYIRPALPYVITFAAGGTIGVLAANYFGDDDEDDDAGIDAE